jgi:hypothetical protein
MTANPYPTNLPPANLVMPDFSKSPGGFGVGATASNKKIYLAVLEEYANGSVRHLKTFDSCLILVVSFGRARWGWKLACQWTASYTMGQFKSFSVSCDCRTYFGSYFAAINWTFELTVVVTFLCSTSCVAVNPPYLIFFCFAVQIPLLPVGSSHTESS